MSESISVFRPAPATLFHPHSSCSYSGSWSAGLHHRQPVPKMVPVGLLSNPVLPALLGTPFHARSSHSWRAHGMLLFTTTNPRWKNAGWFIEFRGYLAIFPTAFHAHPSRSCSGGESQRRFATSEALKIQILFKGTCVKYCRTRPMPVGCRHFFELFIFLVKKWPAALRGKFYYGIERLRFWFIAGFYFHTKKSFIRFYSHSKNSLIWKSFQRKWTYKHLSIR